MEFVTSADIVVIGGGITGTAVLRELSKYNLDCLLVEKEPDLAMGTTKANSAILHAGFDAPTGSLKALTNVRGNKLYHDLEKELDLDIKWTGSMVAATNEEEMQTLQELLQRGRANGVEGLKILTHDEVLREEPNLKTVLGALWAPTAGVCWPFGAAVAFAECAVQNGARVMRDCRVLGFIKEDGRIAGVETNRGVIKTRYVVNASGIYADEIARLAGDESFTINPRKGEYILFDKTACSSLVYGVVFPTPTKKSKGILICTTTHGNTFIGPNAQDLHEREDLAVTTEGMNEIMASARKLIPNLPMGASITEFAGLRAVSSTGDFIVGASGVAGFYNAAGMQSPGLTSAPAVAEILAGAIAEDSGAVKKADFKKDLPRKVSFCRMTRSQQAAVIEKNKLYGRVICRCETVTEAEIVEAIKGPCGARTVDGVKRRTRAGMGRCQGGFCGPRVTQIIARELNIPIPEVLKERADSHLFYEKNQADREEA
ncbi:MAG: NAD(P)/FAD-dependent oxidoreductase [Phascolarctobacterium sp.]|nr:NAD(P)/FAD-dependent oxidoreductase [Phascolarctobacterium sp.]